MLDVTETKFGFNSDLNAKIMFKVKRNVGQTKGTFPVGFAIQIDTARLFIFKDAPENIIGECPVEIVKDWLQATIKDCGYCSEIIYYTGVEEVENGSYAINPPLGVVQWMDISCILDNFKQMLAYIASS